jgi:hypothetical protein
VTAPLLGTPTDKEIEMADDKDRTPGSETVLSHQGIDDKWQIEVEVVPPLDPSLQRKPGSGDVKVIGGDVQGALYPWEEDPMYEALKDTETFQYRKQYIFKATVAGEWATTDCSANICDDAIAVGYRPCGDAKIEDAKDHPNGVSKIVTWVVPVKATGGKSPDELAARDGDKAAQDKVTDKAPEPKGPTEQTKRIVTPKAATKKD